MRVAVSLFNQQHIRQHKRHFLAHSQPTRQAMNFCFYARILAFCLRCRRADSKSYTKSCVLCCEVRAMRCVLRCLLCCFSTTPSRRMCQWQYGSMTASLCVVYHMPGCKWMRHVETCLRPRLASSMAEGRGGATHHTHLLNCSGGAQDERREWRYYQRLSSCWFALVLCFRTHCLRALWTADD